MLFLSSLNTARGPGRSRIRKLAGKQTNKKQIAFCSHSSKLKKLGLLDRVLIYDKVQDYREKCS